jgi:hypothetical protein
VVAVVGGVGQVVPDLVAKVGGQVGVGEHRAARSLTWAQFQTHCNYSPIYAFGP